MHLADHTRIVFRVGYVCARFSNKPIPQTTDEMFAILQDVGLNVVKGQSFEEVDKRLTEFLNKKSYDAAMKIV